MDGAWGASETASSAKWAVDGSRRARDLFFCLAAFLAAVGRPVASLRDWAGRMLGKGARAGRDAQIDPKCG